MQTLPRSLSQTGLGTPDPIVREQASTSAQPTGGDRAEVEDQRPDERAWDRDANANGSGSDGTADERGDQPSLSRREQEVLDRLKDRDREVREHEAAHARVGGQYAGIPSYSYEIGPDGRAYATAGSVPIDVAPVFGDPEATIQKMAVVKRAALAPSEPSPTDRRVAQLAEMQARLAEQRLAAEERAERIEALDRAAKEQARLAAIFEIFQRLRGPEPGTELDLAA